MFRVIQNIVRKPIPVLCAIGIVGFLNWDDNPAKPSNPWGTSVEAAPAKPSIIASAADTAIDYAAEVDTTGTVSKLRGTAKETTETWDNNAQAVEAATAK